MNNSVLVVGGGPAGLAAAINAGAEGLRTTIIEQTPRFGGRVRPSHAIENYLGFLSISGRELADNAYRQLDKFGVERVAGDEVCKLGVGPNSSDWSLRRVQLKDGRTFAGDAIIIATGMSPTDADVPGVDLWGVFYHADPLEIPKWEGKRVWVVGSENSAVQAALNLGNHGVLVTLLVKDASMGMSAYLKPILLAHPNISIVVGKLLEIRGDHGCCQSILVEETKPLTGDWSSLSFNSLFTQVDAVILYNGAKPQTKWLLPRVVLDSRGFIETDPITYMTNVPGVFAVGDCRANSVKRVGAAVGEGTAVIRRVMTWLQRQAAENR